MGLLNNLILILAIKILFLKVNIWHVNAIPFIDPSLIEFLQLKLKRSDAVETFNDTNCNEPISRKISKYVPYTETYRYRPIPERGYPWSPFYQIKTRLNYKRQFHITWTCCEGYVQSGTMCVPRCPRSCEKGTCKEPDVCTCNKGYRMSSDGSCVPECTNGCVNGTCIEPEVCSCNENYWLDSDGFTCRPVCDAECERYHGYCSEPNVCTCHTGYTRIGNESSPFMCKPVCNRPCTNGRCAAPNVCTMCLDGYEMSINISEYKYKPFICRPKCEEPCVFGTCTAPGTCTCDHGYRAVNASVCEPICSKPCKMGVCVAPETCSCNEGYKHHGSSYECEPVCENECVNGICIAPGLCYCNAGFIYDEPSKTCKPHCAAPCGSYGECTAPNKCTCFEGYQKIYSNIMRRFWVRSPYMIMPIDLCQPICDFDCVNGICTAPNVCTCHPDYYPSWIEFHQQPVDNNTQHVCIKRSEPPCNAFSCGDNGTCHESGVCVCNNGYAKDTDGVCVPFCSQECLDGTCIAPNRCACHDGFAPRNDGLCEPVCERGCQNGDCVGPNRCVCHDDFIPNFDHHSRPECIPMCTRNCSRHGECVIDRDHDYKCECHYGWAGRECDEPTMCVIKMAYDRYVINRITIRNDTNSTIMRAYESAPNCYQCNDSFDNATLCYVMQSDEDNATNIGCLFSTDLPCYTTSLYNVSINVTMIPVWPFVILALLLITGPTTVAVYLIYRKRQKKKLPTASISTNVFVREAFATECLLSDI